MTVFLEDNIVAAFWDLFHVVNFHSGYDAFHWEKGRFADFLQVLTKHETFDQGCFYFEVFGIGFHIELGSQYLYVYGLCFYNEWVPGIFFYIEMASPVNRTSLWLP